MSIKDFKDILHKPNFGLIPPEVERAYAEVLSVGSVKYKSRQWEEKGFKYSKCLEKLKRHLNTFELGEVYNDEDGGLCHLKHVLFWIAALITYEERGMVHLNDLPLHHKQLKRQDMITDTLSDLIVEYSDPKVTKLEISLDKTFNELNVDTYMLVFVQVALEEEFEVSFDKPFDANSTYGELLDYITPFIGTSK